MMAHKTRGLQVIGGVAVFLCLLVAASFLADGQRMAPVEQLERTVTNSPHEIEPSREHWYASGQGPDDGHRPITWSDVIRNNYPTEPQYDLPEEQLYRQNPASFLRVVRPGVGSMMLRDVDAPSALDQSKDRWYMAGRYDDHARELHGHIPQIGKYVQAGYPSDYKSPSDFPLGAPEYAAVSFCFAFVSCNFALSSISLPWLCYV